MSKLLSIIVPTYNMENYLHKCLDSLIVSDINMEYLEILVVNDGSKDASSQIAHEYETKYPQTFKVIDKENNNYGSCINSGLKEITGKYVKVLDADDYYVTDALDKFIDYLQDKDVDLVINDFVIVNDNDTILESYTFDLPTNKDFTLKDINKKMIEWIWHHGITYRTNILKSINYHQTEGISYTDDEWIFIPMYKVESVVYFPDILYKYLRGREGQTFDPKIVLSSFDKRIIVGKAMIKYYAHIYDAASSTAKYYMTEKLLRRMSVIYHFYLVQNYSYEGINLLKDFDMFIKKQSLCIYNLFDQIKDNYIGYHYIKQWRASNYKRTLYLQVRRVICKFKMLLGVDFVNHIHMPAKLHRK